MGSPTLDLGLHLIRLPQTLLRNLITRIPITASLPWSSPYSLSILILAVTFLITLYLYCHQHNSSRSALALAGIPSFKASKLKWMFDAETLIRTSYAQYRDTPYLIRATEGAQLIVPARFMPELKPLPESVLSATEAVAEALQSKYTGFSPGHNGELLSTLVKCKLSQNLARLMPRLREELEHIVAGEFPSERASGADGEWVPVKFQPFALRSTARMTGRVFVGSAISRTEAWMDTSINYAVHVFLAVVKLQLFPEWLRPVGKHLVSELGQIKRDIAAARALLEPVIEERLRDRDGYGYSSSSSTSSLSSASSMDGPPDDLIQWLVDALPENEKTDIQAQTELQLILAAASIHTTNNLLTECMYDLAARPDVQDVLREEARQVLEVENGWERKDSLARLRKMDSFMKESQRLSGNITTFIRKVIEPITLSDGTHLPAGTKILSPLAGISRDERFYPDPERFDALRFYKLRQQSVEMSNEAPMANPNRWQFTSIGDAGLHFGAGKHACPGRFFAANVIKMTLAFFLLRYDIKLQDGQARPKPMVMVMSKAPDSNAELLFRKRPLVAV